MLAVGILAIFSVGLAGMMGSTGSAEVEEQDLTPETPDEEIEVETPAAAPSEDAEPDTDVVVDDTLEVANDLPPADLPLPRSENQVSVTLATGEVADDSSVLSDGPNSGENADRTFILTPPTGDHAISVEFDEETTYAIEYNADTQLVLSGLNSNIDGPEGVDTEETVHKVDAAGTPFTETLITREFEGAPQIILTIDQSHVGDHVAQIDLTNPDASLELFFTRMESGVHLVYDEVDSNEGDSFITTRTLYIIETPQGVEEVSEDAKEGIIAEGFDPENGARLIAEVDLGHSLLINHSGTNGTGPYFQTLGNFINEDPDIGTNFFWMTNNAEEELAEDETGPNIWRGVNSEEASTPENTGLVLERGTTIATQAAIGDGGVLQAQDENGGEEAADGLNLNVQGQTELERALDLQNQANQNLRDLGINV